MLYGFTVYDVARRNAGLFSARLAIVNGERRLTFKQFLEEINRLAVGLRREGIKQGDRIAIVSRNNLESFLLFLPRLDWGQSLFPLTLA